MMNILIFIAKIIGRLWIYIAIPFRFYARNYVYNYILFTNRKSWLSRLWQRKPEWNQDSMNYILHDIHGIGQNGIVSYRKTNTLFFWLIVLFIYGWLDDDANEDTTDAGYINSITQGPKSYHNLKIDRTGFLQSPDIMIARHFLPKFKKGDIQYGNSFDLGDCRKPFYNFWCTFVWNNRNTAMNFQYLFKNY